MVARTDLDEIGFHRFGFHVIIWDRAQIIHPVDISLGNHVMIDDFALINGKGGLQIGSYVHIVSFASITGGGGCRIGDFTCISGGARIFSGTENVEDSLFGPDVLPYFRDAIRSPVEIGDHVLVGANSVILPGAKLSDGVVIGAGSVVLEDQVCEEWGIYVGSPAHKVRKRESSEIIRKARLQWYK